MSKATQQQRRDEERQVYSRLILRLSANGTLPFDEYGKSAMVDTLQRDTENQEHAARTIEHLLGSGGPEMQWTLSDLRKAIRSTATKAQAPYNPNCPHCGGLGWAQVFALHTETREGKKREWISQEQYESLLGKIDKRFQSLHEGSRACPAGCQPRGVGYNAETTR